MLPTQVPASIAVDTREGELSSEEMASSSRSRSGSYSGDEDEGTVPSATMSPGDVDSSVRTAPDDNEAVFPPATLMPPPITPRDSDTAASRIKDVADEEVADSRRGDVQSDSSRSSGSDDNTGDGGSGNPLDSGSESDGSSAAASDDGAEQDADGSNSVSASESRDKEKPVGGMYRALYQYKPLSGEQIALRKGELLRNVVKVSQNWLNGENSAGERGMFPANYVKEAEEVEVEKEQEGEEEVESGVEASADRTSDCAAAGDSNSRAGDSTQASASAADASAESQQEQNGNSGDEGDDGSEEGNNGDEGDDGSEEGPPAHLRVVKAKYNFAARRPEELTIRKGDLVELLASGHLGAWWQGRVLDGREGLFPSNYAVPLSAEEEDAFFAAWRDLYGDDAEDDEEGRGQGRHSAATSESGTRTRDDEDAEERTDGDHTRSATGQSDASMDAVDASSRRKSADEGSKLVKGRSKGSSSKDQSSQSDDNRGRVTKSSSKGRGSGSGRKKGKDKGKSGGDSAAAGHGMPAYAPAGVPLPDDGGVVVVGGGASGTSGGRDIVRNKSTSPQSRHVHNQYKSSRASSHENHVAGGAAHALSPRQSSSQSTSSSSSPSSRRSSRSTSSRRRGGGSGGGGGADRRSGVAGVAGGSGTRHGKSKLTDQRIMLDLPTRTWHYTQANGLRTVTSVFACSILCETKSRPLSDALEMAFRSVLRLNHTRIAVFLFRCIDAKSGVKLEAEVTLIKSLDHLRGVVFRRMEGDAWAYKQLVAEIASHMELKPGNKLSKAQWTEAVAASNVTHKVDLGSASQTYEENRMWLRQQLQELNHRKEHAYAQFSRVEATLRDKKASKKDKTQMQALMPTLQRELVDLDSKIQLLELCLARDTNTLEAVLQKQVAQRVVLNEQIEALEATLREKNTKKAERQRSIELLAELRSRIDVVQSKIHILSLKISADRTRERERR